MRFCVNFYQRVNSLLEVTQDEIIKMYLHVKAFVEMSSPMDCLPWVFPCHVSVGPKPITYSCGFTVELGFGCHLLTHDTQFKGGGVIPGMGNEDSCATPLLGWAASAPDEVIHI